jgi:hypothetical protein
MLTPFKGIKQSPYTGIYYKFEDGQLLHRIRLTQDWAPCEFKNREGNMKHWVKVKPGDWLR